MVRGTSGALQAQEGAWLFFWVGQKPGRSLIWSLLQSGFLKGSLWLLFGEQTAGG